MKLRSESSLEKFANFIEPLQNQNGVYLFDFLIFVFMRKKELLVIIGVSIALISVEMYFFNKIVQIDLKSNIINKNVKTNNKNELYINNISYSHAQMPFESLFKEILVGNKKETKPAKMTYNIPTSKRSFKCSTFVSNLTTGGHSWKNLCCNVIQGEPYDLNKFIFDEWRKKKENEGYKFSVSITDNTKKTELSYQASFWLYEETKDIRQYHNIHDNQEIKALIFDKNHYCWQILVFQNNQYKILSCYLGSHYINAFNITKNNSNFDY